MHMHFKSSYIMLSDFLRLQKVLLNHSGISSLNSASLFSYCLAYTSSFAGVKTEVCHPFTSPDSIALADREGKVGVQPRLQFSLIIFTALTS